MISGVRANDYSENACAQYIFPKTAQDSISASVVASTKPIPMAATASAVAQHELDSTQLSCGRGRGRYSALRLGNSQLATGNCAWHVQLNENGNVQLFMRKAKGRGEWRRRESS